ncbi:MAG: MopE-related protein, partial [Myxococcota bacterium]
MMNRAWMVTALLVACGGFEGSGAGTPSLVIAPATIEFGTAPVGVATRADLTLTNEGGGEINLLSITLTNGDPDVFSVDRSSVQTIAAGASGVVGVFIDPEEEGRQYTGAIQVRTDAPDGNRTVTLRGIGGQFAGDNDGDGFSPAQGDCDDDNDQVFPGAVEVCDGLDNDCSGSPLPDELDDDDDGWFVCNGDCDDFDDTVNPGEVEICDGDKDNDCDPTTNERADGDGDGLTICPNADGDEDCDDTEPLATTVDAEEVCDGADNNCDGTVDDVDEDNDGVSRCDGQGRECDPTDPTAACDPFDNDPDAFPVVVSPNGDNAGAGTDADPFETIDFAL